MYKNEKKFNVCDAELLLIKIDKYLRIIGDNFGRKMMGGQVDNFEGIFSCFFFLILEKFKLNCPRSDTCSLGTVFVGC